MVLLLTDGMASSCTSFFHSLHLSLANVPCLCLCNSWSLNYKASGPPTHHCPVCLLHCPLSASTEALWTCHSCLLLTHKPSHEWLRGLLASSRSCWALLDHGCSGLIVSEESPFPSAPPRTQSFLFSCPVGLLVFWITVRIIKCKVVFVLCFTCFSKHLPNSQTLPASQLQSLREPQSLRVRAVTLLSIFC